MTVELVSPFEERWADLSNYKGCFSRDERELIEKQYFPREVVPIGQPGKSCENNLFLGFFFDGTRNNYALSEESGKPTHSNVARLCAWVLSGDPHARLAWLTQQTRWPTDEPIDNLLQEGI